MEELQNKIGRTFIKDRHGIKQKVILEDIWRDKVKVREVDHEDGFTLPIAKFAKFFKEVA